MPHGAQAVASVLGTEGEEWGQHPDVRLDHPLAEYRAVLDAWGRARRERGGHITVVADASAYIDWPEIQEPPCYPDQDQEEEEGGGGSVDTGGCCCCSS